MSFLMPSFIGILRHTRCREGSVSIAQRFAIGPYEREQPLESLQGTWFSFVDATGYCHVQPVLFALILSCAQVTKFKYLSRRTPNSHDRDLLELKSELLSYLPPKKTCKRTNLELSLA